MIPMSATIVAHGRGDRSGLGDQRFDGFPFVRSAGDGFVQIVDIGLMVFAMMDLHRERIEMWLQGIMAIRKGGKGEGHIL